MEGVRKAQFDPRRGELIIQYDQDKTTLQEIIDKLREDGVDVSPKK